MWVLEGFLGRGSLTFYSFSWLVSYHLSSFKLLFHSSWTARTSFFEPAQDRELVNVASWCGLIDSYAFFNTLIILIEDCDMPILTLLLLNAKDDPVSNFIWNLKAMVKGLCTRLCFIG